MKFVYSVYLKVLDFMPRMCIAFGNVYYLETMS